MTVLHPKPVPTPQELMRRFPDIKWRTPLYTTLLGQKHTRLACRLCIAIHGITPADLLDMPRTTNDFAKHMAFEHNLIAIL
jgi:hypothetical protein